MSVAETTHGADCGCTRCTGFQPGHEVSVKHGAYSRKLLAGEAEHLAAEFEQVAPDATSPVIALAGVTMAQLFRASKALEAAGADADLDELKRDAHRWAARCESLFTRMGLLGETPIVGGQPMQITLVSLLQIASESPDVGRLPVLEVSTS